MKKGFFRNPSRKTRRTTAVAIVLAILLSAVGNLSAVTITPPPPSTPAIDIAIIDDSGTTVMSRNIALADLGFPLSPYVTAVTTDLSSPEPSALHALVALLEAEGRDATDKAVLDAADSAFGVYVASILGSSDPFYWTFRVDGADSWTGVFDHKLTAGESLEFILTEYVPEPPPPPGFVHPASGLPAQEIDIPAVLTAISATYAGTVNDWAILGMARYGQADRVGLEAWLAAACTRLTARRVTTTDLELTALVLTALGSDARDIRVDGMKTDLIAMIAAAPDMQTYEFIFGLAALDSASYPEPDGAVNTRASMVAGLLAARLPDGGWSWAPTEPISDTDTTAMAISVLARYAAGDTEVSAAIDTALDLLSSWQAEDGTMGSSNATAMMLIALGSLGRDGQTDSDFADEAGNLLSGLFRYRTSDNRFGYKDTAFDAYATEQAFRSLVTYRKMLDSQTAQSPYVFRTSTEGLVAGTALSCGSDIAETGEYTTLESAIGFTLISSALAALILVLRRDIPGRNIVRRICRREEA